MITTIRTARIKVRISSPMRLSSRRVSRGKWMSIIATEEFLKIPRGLIPGPDSQGLESSIFLTRLEPSMENLIWMNSNF